MKLLNRRPDQTSSKWHYHRQKLELLRARLNARSVAGVDDFAVVGLPEIGGGFNPNLTFGILLEEEDPVAEIDAALRRIEDGSYGICQLSGELIPDERLRVVPWTRYTRQALERLESGGHSRRSAVVRFQAHS